MTNLQEIHNVSETFISITFCPHKSNLRKTRNFMWFVKGSHETQYIKQNFYKVKDPLWFSRSLSGKTQIGFQNKEYITHGNCLVVQWLGLSIFTAKGPGSIPSQENQIPEASWHCRETKQTNKKQQRLYHLGFECGESKIRVFRKVEHLVK